MFSITCPSVVPDTENKRYNTTAVFSFFWCKAQCYVATFIQRMITLMAWVSFIMYYNRLLENIVPLDNFLNIEHVSEREPNLLLGYMLVCCLVMSLAFKPSGTATIFPCGIMNKALATGAPTKRL